MALEIRSVGESIPGWYMAAWNGPCSAGTTTANDDLEHMENIETGRNDLLR